jgi:molecular chaperone Hsp33
LAKRQGNTSGTAGSARQLKKIVLMSELHKFLFDGLPVRGMIVRLTDAWQEILRGAPPTTPPPAWPWPVAEMLGEMAAAGTLMQSNIKFNGALILQIFGDGPVKVAVAECQPDLSLRATAKVVGEVPPTRTCRTWSTSTAAAAARSRSTRRTSSRAAGLPGRGAAERRRRAGQLGKLSDVLEHYMRQSEQLDTKLVLAADDKVAAGLLIQRLPAEGRRQPGRRWTKTTSRWSTSTASPRSYNRISSLEPEARRTAAAGRGDHPAPPVLAGKAAALRPQARRRAFRLHLQPRASGQMIRGLGAEEAESILAERGEIDVSCDFCGQHYRFDAVDAAQIFRPPTEQIPGSPIVQ